MPVYEEKFLSPLAVRFSSEVLRSRFANGQALDKARRPFGGLALPTVRAPASLRISLFLCSL